MNNKNTKLAYFLYPIIDFASIINKSKESVIKTHKLRRRISIKGIFQQENFQPDIMKCLAGGGIWGFCMFVFFCLIMGFMKIIYWEGIGDKDDIFSIQSIVYMMGICAIGGVIWGILFYFLFHGIIYYSEGQSCYWKCSKCTWKSTRVYRHQKNPPICQGIMQKLRKLGDEFTIILLAVRQMRSLTY